MKKKLIILIPVICILLLNYGLKSDDNFKPTFYTANGTKLIVDKWSCEELEASKDLSVKFPLPAQAFNYDKVAFYLSINLWGNTDRNDVAHHFLDYQLTYLKNSFELNFNGKKEAVFALVNPNGKDEDYDGNIAWNNLYNGDLRLFTGVTYYPYDSKIGYGSFCKCKKNKPQIAVTASLVGYTITGFEKYWDESSESWKKEPQYQYYYIGESTPIFITRN